MINVRKHTKFYRKNNKVVNVDSYTRKNPKFNSKPKWKNPEFNIPKRDTSYDGWDSHQSWELALALDNEQAPNNNLFEYYKNYKKKYDKGNFDEEKAIKGLIGWINKWSPELRRKGYITYSTTPMEVKREVAKAKLKDFYSEMKYL